MGKLENSQYVCLATLSRSRQLEGLSLAGGINAWRRAGLPTSSSTHANGKEKPTILKRPQSFAEFQLN
jgi:hypothetical protein